MPWSDFWILSKFNRFRTLKLQIKALKCNVNHFSPDQMDSGHLIYNSKYIFKIELEFKCTVCRFRNMKVATKLTPDSMIKI